MKRVLVTQRVDVVSNYAERRDALDQRWIDLMIRADLEPVIVPNSRHWVETHLATRSMEALLLTGGNSLAMCGGDAPERDEAEQLLLNSALQAGVPVIGVCRGMQLLLHHFGIELKPVEGHVAIEQTLEIAGKPRLVNSYHDWGATHVSEELVVWARAADGVVKAIRHNHLPVWGIMWHPERITPYHIDDLALLRLVLGGEEAL